MKLGELLAIVIGGIATILACVLATVEMARGGFGWLMLPLLAAMFWREAVFARMRMELDQVRGDDARGNSPI